MKKFLIAATVAAFIATPAAAEEPSNFAGAKLGVVAGFDEYTLSGLGFKGSKTGFHYGVTAGYDVELNGAIVGLEAEASDATTEESDFGGPLVAGRELYVGARVGKVVTSTLLVYAKGGYANSRLKLEGGGPELAGNLHGYRLGAGIEYAPSKFFGRAEYRYTDFDKIKIQGQDSGLSARRHQIVGTLGLRF